MERTSEITHAGTRTVGAELANGSEALQAALKKAAIAVGDGIQHGRDDVIAYARREPGTALMAAAALGFLVGLALAMGSRPAHGGGAWLPQLSSRRRGFLGRGAGSGWRELLHLG